MFSPVILVALAVGYLLGSIPFGLLLTRLSGRGDVRDTGSGNIGATNVLRHAGKKLGALTLACDLLKGTAGVFAGMSVVGALGGDLATALNGAVFGGLGAFLGHLYPVWLRFKGGKGVATLIGVLLGLDWRLAVAFCACWVVTAAIGRISSLSALVATAVVFLLGWFMEPRVMALTLSVMSLLVFWRHRENITRILGGEEPRIGARKSETAGDT